MGPDGPLLLQDHYLVQKMAQFNRERVPERVVHAKGGGAYGFLTITEDVSQFTKARLFAPGARTEASAIRSPPLFVIFPQRWVLQRVLHIGIATDKDIELRAQKATEAVFRRAHDRLAADVE